MPDNWISVEERLPENRNTYLLCPAQPNETSMTSGYWDGEYWRGRRIDGEFFAIQWSKNAITHWQPIEPPEEK